MTDISVSFTTTSYDVSLASGVVGIRDVYTTVQTSGAADFTGSTHTPIQAAVDLGTDVYVGPGTYTISTKITLNNDKQKLVCSKNTTFIAANALNNHVVHITGDDVEFYPGIIDGNGTNQTATSRGVYIDAAFNSHVIGGIFKDCYISSASIAAGSIKCSIKRARGYDLKKTTGSAPDHFIILDSPDCVIEDCFATGQPQASGNLFAIFAASDPMSCKGSKIINCVGDTSSGNGFNLEQTHGAELINCVSKNNTMKGFNITGSSSTLYGSFNSVRGCKSYNDTQVGFTFNGTGRMNMIDDCSVEQSGADGYYFGMPGMQIGTIRANNCTEDGVNFYQADRFIASNIIVWNNNSGDGNDYGVRIDDCDGWVATIHAFNDGTSGEGVQEANVVITGGSTGGWVLTAHCEDSTFSNVWVVNATHGVIHATTRGGSYGVRDQSPSNYITLASKNCQGASTANVSLVGAQDVDLGNGVS